MDKLKPKRTVTIRWEELEYVPRYEVVNEENSDEVYGKLKNRHGIRNLRRI
jgi:hypothetical protein